MTARRGSVSTGGTTHGLNASGATSRFGQYSLFGLYWLQWYGKDH